MVYHAPRGGFKKYRAQEKERKEALNFCFGQGALAIIDHTIIGHNVFGNTLALRPRGKRYTHVGELNLSAAMTEVCIRDARVSLDAIKQHGQVGIVADECKILEGKQRFLSSVAQDVSHLPHQGGDVGDLVRELCSVEEEIMTILEANVYNSDATTNLFHTLVKEAWGKYAGLEEDKVRGQENREKMLAAGLEAALVFETPTVVLSRWNDPKKVLWMAQKAMYENKAVARRMRASLADGRLQIADFNVKGGRFYIAGTSANFHEEPGAEDLEAEILDALLACEAALPKPSSTQTV